MVQSQHKFENTAIYTRLRHKFYKPNFEYKHNLQLYIAETKVHIEDLQLPQVDTEEFPN